MMDDSQRAQVISRRRWCGGLWLAVLAVGTLGVYGREGQLAVVTWFASLGLVLISAIGGKPESDERLVHPAVYRPLAVATFVVLLGAALLGVMPGASERSKLWAVCYGVLALLAYRGMTARGARPAMLTVAIGLWLWLPFFFFTHLGCKPHGHFHEPHWTEVMSDAVLPAMLFLIVAQTAAALFAFQPRPTDEVPEARALR